MVVGRVDLAPSEGYRVGLPACRRLLLGRSGQRERAGAPANRCAWLRVHLLARPMADWRTDRRADWPAVKKLMGQQFLNHGLEHGQQPLT